MKRTGTVVWILQRFLLCPGRRHFATVWVRFLSVGISFGRNTIEGLAQGWQSSEASSDKAWQEQTFSYWLF